MPDIIRYQPLLDQFGEAVKLNEPLRRHTVARLGGPADVLISAKHRNVLAQVAEIAWKFDLPLRILGAGANVLISDAGFRGVVLINNTDDHSVIMDSLNSAENDRIVADSGLSLARLARMTIEQGLSGFEWAISVPGTVGGAVVNNAGAHGSDMAANLVSVGVLLENETWQWLPVEQMQYRYRESMLKHSERRFVVLGASFRFEPGHDPAELRARADEYIAHRKRTQPPGASLGSMFKNPPGDYAGRLIEAAGLKGTRSGGVIISSVHANFFVNTGDGTASDYIELIRLAQNTVLDKFGMKLELEVELIGEGF